MTIVRSSAYSLAKISAVSRKLVHVHSPVVGYLFITRMEVLLVSVAIAHRCLVVRIVCITIPLLKFWCGMALLFGLTPILIVVL